jgi:hypothetical protein
LADGGVGLRSQYFFLAIAGPAVASQPLRIPDQPSSPKYASDFSVCTANGIDEGEASKAAFPTRLFSKRLHPGKQPGLRKLFGLGEPFQKSHIARCGKPSGCEATPGKQTTEPTKSLVLLSPQPEGLGVLFRFFCVPRSGKTTAGIAASLRALKTLENPLQRALWDF